MRRRRASMIVTLSLLTLTAPAAAQGKWAFWGGIETIGRPMWVRAETFASRSDCEKSTDRYVAAWVSRMEAEDNQPVRVGTDVIARLSSGSLLTMHFVCLPDTKDPRVR